MEENGVPAQDEKPITGIVRFLSRDIGSSFCSNRKSAMTEYG
ncbi:hypothetical protein [Parageobacillus thermoglucosidasius]|nr:hypothetical protein [Parageobacillus thermoglucosidasius]MED4906202.1 hypothetical protein [Parageobacillus thermoglucosidasius]MED4915358.1 hypothetical protein [Parageobacillus thermoglucosidasius]MED4944771.1 hypothetical protein [Parageobacillus thermoglucosidasius]MED4983937.1 hypothetical protein [Parageobacillus thermoglucosidasius]